MKESQEDDDADLISDLLKLELHINGSKHTEEVYPIGRFADNKGKPSSLLRASIKK